jgi:dipeptidyl aminopeptidase/acylaminoacyl peptidase
MRSARIGSSMAVTSVAVAVALLPALAAASFPGANGRIFFTADAPGSTAPDVWSVSPDGSDPLNLTDLPGGPGDGRDPSVSATGLVAFAAGSDAGTEIWTMNTDGSGQHRVTSNAALDEMPAASPDGSRIAFVTNRDGPGDLDIWTIGADGSGAAALLAGGGRDLDPAFTPDGRYVLSSSEVTGDFDIAYVAASGGPFAAATAITAQSNLDESEPSPTPDGVRLAFSRNTGGEGDIWSAFYDGTDEFGLAVDPALGETSPAYSPDGTEVVYAAGVGLVVAAAGGAQPVPLHTGIANAPRDPDWAVGSALDREPPKTRITRSPRREIERSTASLRFRSDEPGSSFECRLDRRRFSRCESPRRYRRLDPGKHVFRVRAIDATGNTDPSPAKAKFKVVTDS